MHGENIFTFILRVQISTVTVFRLYTHNLNDILFLISGKYKAFELVNTKATEAFGIKNVYQHDRL